MTKQINLKKNISISLVARVLTMLLGFVSSIFITRYLGPELKGKMSYFLALSGIIWMVLDAGFHKSMPYLLAKDNQRKHQIFSFSIILHFVELAFLIIAFMIFRDVFLVRLEATSFWYLALLVVFTVVTHLSFKIKFIMLGLDRIIWQNYLKFLPNASYLLLFLLIKLFLPVQDKLLYVLFVLVLANIFWTYFYTFKVFIKEKITLVYSFDFKEIFLCYQLGIKAFLGGFFIFLLIRFDIFLIKRYDTLAELGIYSLAANFVTLLQSFSNIVGSLMLPKFAANETGEKENIIILKKVIIIFLLLFVFISILFLTVGRPVIAAVYGQEFIRSADVFALLLPAVLFLAVGSLINTYFWSKGFPLTTIILPLVALAVNIGLNLYLIPRIGILGAAIATSISYFIWMILLIIYFFNSKLIINPGVIKLGFNDFKFLYQDTLGKKMRKKR